MENYVFNIGFYKSGTCSLAAALNMLGIPTVHHIIRKIELYDIITENKNNNQKLFHGLDTTYQGFSDFRGERYFRELYAQYPNSKFIFTIRPLEDWLTSIQNWKLSKCYDTYTFIKNNEQKYLELAKLIKKSRRTIKKEQFNKKHRIRHYRRYKKEIRKFFKDKPNQFLELRICEGEGWPELCSFLNLDQPNVDFPRRNVTPLLKK